VCGSRSKPECIGCFVTSAGSCFTASQGKAPYAEDEVLALREQVDKDGSEQIELEEWLAWKAAQEELHRQQQEDAVKTMAADAAEAKQLCAALQAEKQAAKDEASQLASALETKEAMLLEAAQVVRDAMLAAAEASSGAGDRDFWEEVIVSKSRITGLHTRHDADPTPPRLTSVYPPTAVGSGDCNSRSVWLDCSTHQQE
jgi:hypothetical protein